MPCIGKAYFRRVAGGHRLRSTELLSLLGLKRYCLATGISKPLLVFAGIAGRSC